MVKDSLDVNPHFYGNKYKEVCNSVEEYIKMYYENGWDRF
jgi:hypothetical protein